MWRELDFVASANIRTYIQFALNGTRGARDDFKDAEPLVTVLDDKEITSEARIKKLEAEYLALAKEGNDVSIKAIKDYFTRGQRRHSLGRAGAA